MNAENQTCEECGAALAEDAPRGLCPKCLLKAGLASGMVTGESSLPTQTTVIGEADAGPAAGPADSPLLTRPSSLGTVRYFGDYELLEEIARGGMGVVYKARQVSLNRVVALKMILAGQFATEAEVKRFRVEAEAAANLQHPNIVAIHEVGVHEGRHYYSMDYVPGKNLAESAVGKPLAAAQAAGLVKRMAEAVHYAHQRGTLHRDLKPQNVLIDEQGRPRITDFGLAKRAQEDSGLTRSGAVMGSPSYMPPEQAGGQVGELGPPSDVYSLGAVLYELLTGRAPFQGATPTATLMQVLEEEPVPPRQLVPAVPVDLETICLKCLEKRPERRYASARAFAEELERFLNHEPILARPASRMRQAWSWLQKHPWAIAGVAALLIVGLACTAYGLWQQGRYQLWQATHPETVFRPGFQPLLITSGFGLLLLLFPLGWVWRMLRGQFRRHREEGAPIAQPVLRASVVLGLSVMVYCLALFLKVVEMWAWRPRLGQPLGEAFMLPGVYLLLPWAAFMLWVGAVLVWIALGASELSVFGDTVARKMEAADAEADRRSETLPRPKGLVEWLLLLIVPAVLAEIPVLIAWCVAYYAISVAEAGRQTSLQSLGVAVWVAAGAGWLLPAWLFSARWDPTLPPQKLLKRAVLALAVLAGTWGLHARVIGWPLGLALAIHGGSLGLFTAVLIVWGRHLRARARSEGLSVLDFLRRIRLRPWWQLRAREQEDTSGHPQERASLLGVLRDWVAVPGAARVKASKLPSPLKAMSAGHERPRAGEVIGMMVLAVVAGYGPFQTWRYAAADYAYLDALSAAGKTLPRESYSPARVSDAVNFAKTPLLEAIGYRARLNTNRWARFLAFEALAHAEDPSRLAGTPRAFLPGPASAAVPDRSAWAAERLRTLAPLEADFDELRLAAARPFAQVDPASFTAFELDPNRPYSPGYRLLARLLVVHATAQLELGRSDAALRDLRVVQCLADALSGNRRFESMMLRVAVVQSCQEGFGKACASGRWTDAELRQWEAWFATVDLLQDLDLTLRGAEADALNNTFDSPSAALQGFPLYWWWFRDQRLYNELLFGYCDTAFDTRRQQVYPGRSQAFQEQAARRLKDSALGLSAHPLASVHFPDLDQALPKVARIQTLVNLSRVAGALTRYRTNMRRLPSTLNELAPRYLPRVPHDLVGGKPLVYRQTADDQFVLYSIGWNERDDGGVVAPASLGGQDGDWVWK